MSLKKKLIPALVAGVLATAATGASAVPFSGVYVFGDSLSDAGTYRPGLSVALGSAAAAAALGRFTTNPGPVWAELIATTYGGNGAPSNAGGGNYAQGGMRVALPSPASLVGPGGAQRPVSTQITEFLTPRNGTADPNALYAVWVGANDLFSNLGLFQAGAIDQATLQSNVLAAANAEIAQIARLRAAGARYILVFNIPDVGATPQFAGPLAGSVTALSAGYNVTLFTGLQATGVKVIPVDAFALLTDVRANASAFGFTNITTPACLPAGSSSLTCSAANIPAGAATSYLFADGVHPTTGAHKIVADFVTSLIEGPNAYSTMGETPLAMRAAHIRTLEEGLQQGKAAPMGKITAFAAAEGSKYDISRNTLSPQTDTKNKAVTVGVSMRASEDASVGLAVGTVKGESRLGSVGQFDVKENTLSAFASGRWGGFYGSLTASIANLKFDNVRRNVQLGPVSRTATSDTKGANSSASFMAGYDFALGKLSIGPFLSHTAQSVDVNGFSEANAGSANLKIMDQRRDSQVTGVGVRASLPMGAFTPFVRVAMEKENRNDERFVSANPLSVTSGNTYDIPAYRPDSKWVTGSLGVRGRLAERIGLSVVYTSVSSKDSVKQDGVTASVSVDF
ncbi:MAG TPA: autotransporter domain-containing protein [Usitatibacteraceae bacterium]|nr:autotransporter domain-containing protein [Usitatibacteraceae bacterium]